MLQKLKSIFRLDLQYYIFILIALAIPLTKSYLPHLMFLWVLTGILSIHKINKIYYSYFIIFLPFFFYISHIIGLSYTENLKNGFFDLEVKLSLLFIPIVSFFNQKKVLKNCNGILLMFVVANFVASIICLANAFSNSISHNDLGNLALNTSRWLDTNNLSFFQLVNQRYSYFSYTYLSFIHHPSYFSLYILFSIVILVYFIRINGNRNWMYIILISYFSFFLWLLASRAAYLTFLIVILSLLFLLMFNKKRILTSIGVLIFIILSSYIFISNNRLKRNIVEAVGIVEYNKSIDKNSDIRLWLWKSAMDIFKENIWLGVGTGDMDYLLHKKYEEYNLKLAEEHNYNTHNQYLDSAVKLGVFGLGLLLFWILGSLIYAIKKKHFLLFFFSLIVLFNLFFESMLNTIAGVSFIAFFYSLLYADAINKRKRA